jgi:hypothetical protein
VSDPEDKADEQQPIIQQIKKTMQNLQQQQQGKAR